MHFSEVTKGLIGTFDQRNKSCRDTLFASSKAEAAALEESKEESKQASQPSASTENIDLVAVMLKKKQEAAAKANAAKVGAKKGPPPKTQSKP